MLAILIFAGLFVSVPWYSYLIVLLIWFLITLFGSLFIRWDYHVTSFHANRGISRNEVSLTFDDGPNPEFTPKVLDLLKQYNARATFFCIGRNIQQHPQILKEIIANGHTVGNHTYTHAKSFGFFGFYKVRSELQKTSALVKQITGLDMKFFRPCFGVTNPNIARSVKTLNLHSIGWSVRSLDTTFLNETKVLHRITNKLRQGDIILLHDSSEKTIYVLERLLLFLQERKLHSVTVDQLLNLKAYA